MACYQLPLTAVQHGRLIFLTLANHHHTILQAAAGGEQDHAQSSAVRHSFIHCATTSSASKQMQLCQQRFDELLCNASSWVSQ
jgi:hypothetical protein